MPVRPILIVIPVACAGWSCDSLPDLLPNQCGNGVLEPEFGEACDSKVDAALGDNLACGEMGTAGACRYLCTRATCPTGWECGVDRVCREPAGRFTLGPSGVITLVAPAFEVGDIDADGRADLVVHANRRVSTFFGDGLGGFVRRFDVTTTPSAGRPVAHDVTSDAGLDVLVPLSEGLLVLRGRRDQTLTPEILPSFQTFDLTGGRSRTASVEVSGQAESSLIRFRATAGAVVAEPLFPSGPALPLSTSELPNAVASADLDPPGREGPGTEEVILTWASERRVRIVELRCDDRPPEAGCRGPLRLRVRQTLELPPEAADGPLAPWVADVDSDRHPDLIIAAPSGDRDRVSVFFGIGSGLLETQAQPDPRARGPAGSLVAVADLNDDGRTDFIHMFGIRVTTPTATPSRWSPLIEAYDGRSNPSAPWNRAVTADFNRDGRPDVAVSGPSGGVELLLGLGEGRFSDFQISSVQAAEWLASGDFNGDGVTDLAAALVEPTGTQIAVMYGNVQGPLDPPVPMGRVGRIDEFLSTRLPGRTETQDLRSDLVVRSASVTGAGAPVGTTILYGSAERRLVAPLAFLQDGEPPLAADLVVAGRFEPDASSVVVWVKSPEPSAVVLPRSDRGDLAPSRLERTPLPACLPARIDCLRAIARDIDGDGRDRVFAAGPTRSCAGGFGAPSELWVIGTPGGPACSRSTLGPSRTVEDLFAQPARRNVGGGTFVVTTTNPDGRSQIVRRGTEGDLEVIALPSEVRFARSAAWLNADADPELELFVLARDGLFRAEERDTGWRFDPMPANLPGLVPPIVDGQIRARDVNADGLEDLIVGTTNTLAIYLSVEQTTGAAPR